MKGSKQPSVTIADRTKISSEKEEMPGCIGMGGEENKSEMGCSEKYTPTSGNTTQSPMVRYRFTDKKLMLL